MRFQNAWFVSALMLLILSRTATYARPHHTPPSTAPIDTNPTATNLTQSQAIQSATQFCQSAGNFTLVPNVEAQFPSVSRTGCWMNCWEVRFKGQSVVELDDNSGVVTFYRGPQVMQSAPAGPTISQADALAKAASVLQASGVTDFDPSPFVGAPIATSFMSPDGGATVLPSAAGHEWDIAYTRMFGQIPYYDQTIDISLQAETGILNSFAVHYSSPAPVSSNITLTAEQASETAWNLINGTTMQNTMLEGTALFAVQSNHCFIGPDYSEEWLPGPAKIAYCCSLVYQPTTPAVWHSEPDDPLIATPEDKYNSGQGESRVIVFIDAQDGTILGGRESSVRKIVSPSTMPQWITSTREVRVLAKNKRGEWAEKPVAVLSEADNRKWFHQVKFLQTFVPHVPQKKEKQTAVLKLVLVSKTGDHTEEIFYLGSGRLGKPSVQTNLPPELKAWLQNLPQKQTTTASAASPR